MSQNMLILSTEIPQVDADAPLYAVKVEIWVTFFKVVNLSIQSLTLQCVQLYSFSGT